MEAYNQVNIQNGLVDSFLYVVLPIRVSKDRLDAIERLEHILTDRNIPQEVSFVVVDDGSPKELSEQIQTKVAKLGFAYLRINSESQSFSIGRCRNIAASVCPSKYIMFQDIDLLVYDGFYSSVLSEITVQQLETYADRFLMFGVVYLTKEASEEFFQLEPQQRKPTFLQRLFDNDTQSIEKFSTGTSVTLFNREYFLLRGGNDPQFENWGYEDLEFMTRCIRKNRIYPMPEDFDLDYKNFTTINEFVGWKSIYRLFGDRTFYKGIVLFHAWHPVSVSGAYQKGKERNRNLFNQKLKSFKQSNREPNPIPDFTKNVKTLLFRTNAFVFFREIKPRLGGFEVESEFSFETEKDFELYLNNNEITQVLFHNPYANEKMEMLYHYCRANNITYFVAERGALPNSFFFDPGGFLSDSDSYDEKKWNLPITDTEINSVYEYINELKLGESTLEAQGSRKCLNELRSNLGLKEYEKVLFVPMQRPGDSVIKHFIGGIGSYQRFVELVQESAKYLPSSWKIVVKKHPLEDEVLLEASDNILIAPSDMHINDLIELSSAVLLINSGVGLLSLAWSKPLLIAGDAFYSHSSLNSQVVTRDDVVNELKSLKYPSEEERVKFFNYLINHFYSFGKFITRQTSMEDGTRMTATVGIVPHVIRGLGSEELKLEYSPKPTVNTNSILFDRYKATSNRGSGIKQSQNKTSVSTPMSAIKKGKSENESVQQSRQLNIKKKYKKFRTNPDAFFRDSKYSFLRYFSRR